MDPISTALINLGGMGIATAILYKLHNKSLDSFSKELQTERDRNDRNLTTLWAKMDSLAQAWREAQCKYPANYHRES